MKLEQIEYSIKNHPIFDQEIPLQYQLGIPFIEKTNHKLYLSYFMNKQICAGEELQIYPVKFKIVLPFPFSNITYFRNYEDVEADVLPVAVVSTDLFLTKGKQLYRKLYNHVDLLIQEWAEFSDVSDETMDVYQDILKEIIKTLKLEALYGGRFK